MSSQTLLDRDSRARKTLQEVGQHHVLDFWDRLADDQRQILLDQIDSVDWRELDRLIHSHVRNKPAVTVPDHVQPAPWYPHQPPAELAAKYKQARELGWDLIRTGKVAAFTVAGGQGTRLGWDAPKGTFPATPIRSLCLFECFAQYIRNVQKRTGAIIPWYIMTSPVNHEPTVSFFRTHNFFNLNAADVMFFPQAMMPALDLHTGKVLLESPHSMALSPNGHGGSLKALATSGALADMHRRSIDHISYTQVDNPIVRVVDPLFLGLHALDRCEMSSKMLPKCDPFEKLGNFCKIDGRIQVIEYSDLPAELAVQTMPAPESRLRFYAGSIAIHALRVDFVQHLNAGHSENQKSDGLNSGTAAPIRNQKSQGSFSLPFHRAEKKVAHIDLSSGLLVKPEKPNAVKLETFVFDALPLCQHSIIYETDRIDEFAPIKNADSPAGDKPAPDSPASSKAIQIQHAARWLQERGVQIPRTPTGQVNATIEISQLTAIYPEDLKPDILPKRIEPAARIVL